jgi:ABC-type multidrug transport system fused ATPase/permease subunit
MQMSDESRTQIGNTYFWDRVIYWVLFALVLAFVNGLSSFSQKFSWGRLGENVTNEMRKWMYQSILQKHIGWFDHRENVPSVLSASMAKDTSIVNGAATESLSP